MYFLFAWNSYTYVPLYFKTNYIILLSGFSRPTVCLASTIIGIVAETEEILFYTADVWR